MVNKLKKIFQSLGVLFVIIAIIVVASIFNHLKKEAVVTNIPSNHVKEVTYREPIVKLPFKKTNAPIEEKNLPIPKEKISKSINIDLTKIEKGRSIKFDLVIDKKGHIYKTKNMPKNIVVNIKTWKPKLFSADFKFSYTLAVSDNIYHALSLDYFRIWKIYFGSELGISVSNGLMNKLLIGLSLKYSFADLVFENGSSIRISIVAGLNFIRYLPYGGINIKW